MITVLSNARNASLYLIAVVGIALGVLLARPSMPSISLSGPALIPNTGDQNAQDLFRQEELALYNRPAASSIGSPGFYEYRRGEWSTGSVDAVGAFRQEELALYSHRTASSIGTTDALGAFRQEELSLYRRTGGSSIGSPAFMEYRRGEWFGK